MKIPFLALLLLTTTAFARDNNFVVFVGTYTDSGSRGIYSFRFNAESGSMGEIELAATSDNPSFLVPDKSRRFLYAANEIEKFEGKTDGSVSVFKIDLKTAKLTALQQVSSGGWGPVYLSMDKAARHVLVANYGVGSIAVLPIERDGKLGRLTSEVQHVGSHPRPHAIETSNNDRFALVPDLGLNKIYSYRYNAETGSLMAAMTPTKTLPPNTGPRHFAMSPSGKFAYVANETASSVKVYSFDQETGLLQEQQTISTLPAESKIQNTAAEIALDHTGSSLYVSNRGEDTIVLFNVDQKTGKLSFRERYPSGGKTPRTFAIDPTNRWMFVANQGSNEITIFERDPSTGRLAPTSKTVAVTAPAHLIFVPAS